MNATTPRRQGKTPRRKIRREIDSLAFFYLASWRLGVHLFPSRIQPLPAHEAFDRFVLRQAELVIQLGGFAVAFLGALPELAAVVAGEERAVLLAFVLEDGDALALHLLR